jgi:hypothetical protein
VGGAKIGRNSPGGADEWRDMTEFDEREMMYKHCPNAEKCDDDYSVSLEFWRWSPVPTPHSKIT